MKVLISRPGSRADIVELKDAKEFSDYISKLGRVVMTYVSGELRIGEYHKTIEYDIAPVFSCLKVTVYLRDWMRIDYIIVPYDAKLAKWYVLKYEWGEFPHFSSNSLVCNGEYYAEESAECIWDGWVKYHDVEFHFDCPKCSVMSLVFNE